MCRTENPKTVRLGKTAIEVSKIGFGAWAIGSKAYGCVSEADGLACLAAYVEHGGNFIDTATNYGSEPLIGRFMKREGLEEKLVIGSKTPKLTAEGIHDDLERNLRDFQRDYVDLFYLHFPPDNPDEMNRVLDVFERLKNEGKIRAIGASIKGPDVTQATVDLCRQYIHTGRVDALQVIYSIFRQKNRDMFAEAKASDVSIVARGVLESGFLTAKYLPGHCFPNDHRVRWGNGEHLAKILAEALRLRDEFVHPPYKTLPQLAMRFALDEDGVSSIIVGARNARQVKANMRIDELPPIDDESRERLHRRFEGRDNEFNTVAEIPARILRSWRRGPARES